MKGFFGDSLSGMLTGYFGGFKLDSDFVFEKSSPPGGLLYFGDVTMTTGECCARVFNDGKWHVRDNGRFLYAACILASLSETWQDEMNRVLMDMLGRREQVQSVICVVRGYRILVLSRPLLQGKVQTTTKIHATVEGRTWGIGYPFMGNRLPL